MFAWRLALHALPTKERLRSRGVDAADGCYHCGAIEENMQHLFLECPFTKSLLRDSHNVDILGRF